MDPIGVFDSGVGGLTVVAALRRRLPGESILYLGDTARLPYGSKSEETVTRYTSKNVDFLLERGVKAVVVACNTASALALPHLDGHLPVPTWGVIEPGAEKAAAVSRGRVGVIATEATVRSDAYARALARARPDLEVSSRACPLFVPLVEEGWHDDPVTQEIAERYLAPLLAAGDRHPGPRLHALSAPGAGVAAGGGAGGRSRRLRRGGGRGRGRRPGSGRARSSPVAQPSLRLCVTDAGETFRKRRRSHPRRARRAARVGRGDVARPTGTMAPMSAPPETVRRPHGRAADALRPVRIETGAMKFAEGSALIELGDTRVLSRRPASSTRVPPFLKDSGRGWLTAEYSMLPRATHTRSTREVVQGKPVRSHRRDPAADRPEPARRGRLHGHAGPDAHPGLRRAPGRRRHAHRRDHRRLRGGRRWRSPASTSRATSRPGRSPARSPRSRSASSTACRSSTSSTSRTRWRRST